MYVGEVNGTENDRDLGAMPNKLSHNDTLNPRALTLA